MRKGNRDRKKRENESRGKDRQRNKRVKTKLFRRGSYYTETRESERRKDYQIESLGGKNKK